MTDKHRIDLRLYRLIDFIQQHFCHDQMQRRYVLSIKDVLVSSNVWVFIVIEWQIRHVDCHCCRSIQCLNNWAQQWSNLRWKLRLNWWREQIERSINVSNALIQMSLLTSCSHCQYILTVTTSNCSIVVCKILYIF